MRFGLWAQFLKSPCIREIRLIAKVRANVFRFDAGHIGPRAGVRGPGKQRLGLPHSPKPLSTRKVTFDPTDSLLIRQIVCRVRPVSLAMSDVRGLLPRMDPTLPNCSRVKLGLRPEVRPADRSAWRAEMVASAPTLGSRGIALVHAGVIMKTSWAILLLDGCASALALYPDF